ncbi:MAG: hypothetical protein ACLRM8_00740 [Alistipes sp.]
MSKDRWEPPIDRDGSRATATVYILKLRLRLRPGSRQGIVVSEGASASVGNGDVLNFSNPERRARITVTSRSGHGRLVDLPRTYDPFFLGTWRIVDVKLAQPAGQRRRRRSLTTQLSSGEFGTYGLPEYDDRVTITLARSPTTNSPERSSIRPATTGRTAISGCHALQRRSPAGHEPASASPVPPGESQWTLDLTTNQMKITQNNVSSTMIFGTEGNNRLFASCCPAPPENRDATRSTTTCGAVRRNSSTSCIRSATDRRTNR